MGLFILLKSTTVKRSYGILTLVTPLGVDEALKGKIVSTYGVSGDQHHQIEF